MNDSALDRSVTIIAKFEGFRAQAYPDPASPRAVAKRKKQPYEHLSGAPWTIGYGETLNVSEGMTWAEPEAREHLKKRVTWFYLQVSALIPNASPNHLVACVSLAYNIGISAFKTSSVCRLTKRGEYAQAAEKFILWNKANGIPMLTGRRLEEKAIYLS